MNKLGIFESSSPLASYSKGAIQDIATQYAENIIENEDSIQAFAFLKKLESFIEVVKDRIKDDVLKSFDKETESLGVKLSKGKSTSFDYKGCQHPDYMKVIEQKKEIEVFLKGVPNGETPTFVTDSETGEMIRVFPPSSKQSDTVVCKF